EYPLVVVGALVFGYSAVAFRSRVLWFVAGAVPAGLLLLIYQAVAFGDPFTISYETKDLEGGSDTGMAIQPLSTWIDSLVGSRGILWLTPIVGLGLIAAVLARREPSRRRQH